MVAIARAIERNWTSPATLFCVAWAVTVGISAILYIDLADQLLFGTIWVFFTYCCFQLGSMHGATLAKRFVRRNVVNDWKDKRNFLYYWSLIFIVLSLMSMTYGAIATGGQLAAFMDMDELSRLSATNRQSTMQGLGVKDSILSIGLISVYTAPLLSGLRFSITSSFVEKIIQCIPLITAMLTGVINGSRMGVLFGGCFWFSSYLSASNVSEFEIKFDKRKLIYLGFGSIAVFGLGSLFVLFIRYREYSSIDFGKFFERLYDSLVYFPAFSIWLSDGGWENVDLLLGYRTATRPFEWFGFTYDIQPAIPVGNSSSNIFTILRGLIEDFSLMGYPIVVFLFASLSAKSYGCVRAGFPKYLPLLTLCYATILCSVAFSVFTYSTPTLALLLYYLIFNLYLPKTQSQRSPV